MIAKKEICNTRLLCCGSRQRLTCIVYELLYWVVIKLWFNDEYVFAAETDMIGNKTFLVYVRNAWIVIYSRNYYRRWVCRVCIRMMMSLHSAKLWFDVSLKGYVSICFMKQFKYTCCEISRCCMSVTLLWLSQRNFVYVCVRRAGKSKTSWWCMIVNCIGNIWNDTVMINSLMAFFPW